MDPRIALVIMWILVSALVALMGWFANLPSLVLYGVIGFAVGFGGAFVIEFVDNTNWE